MPSKLARPVPDTPSRTKRQTAMCFEFHNFQTFILICSTSEISFPTWKWMWFGDDWIPSWDIAALWKVSIPSQRCWASQSFCWALALPDNMQNVCLTNGNWHGKWLCTVFDHKQLLFVETHVDRLIWYYAVSDPFFVHSCAFLLYKPSLNLVEASRNFPWCCGT